MMDGKYKWVVRDLFCVPIDVTPLIFHTHTYIDGNIIHCTGFEIESVDQQDVNNRAIDGLRFPVKFKSIKVAHIPLNKQLYVHRRLKDG